MTVETWENCDILLSSPDVHRDRIPNLEHNLLIKQILIDLEFSFKMISLLQVQIAENITLP